MRHRVGLLNVVILTLVMALIPTSALAAYMAKPAVYYHAKNTIDARMVSEAGYGCANPTKTKATLQAFVGKKWLNIKPIRSGWIPDKESCGDSSFGSKTSRAWITAYIDPGTIVRWYYVGEISIQDHDSKGNGIGVAYTFSNAYQNIVPHSVVGGYGITWENVSSRINDIAAASWTDAQATILRNANLPSALSGYKSYISPGALLVDPNVGEADRYLKRTFSLFARIPSPRSIIFVATTQEERVASELQIDTMYKDSGWIKGALDDIFGINTSQPAGSVFTQIKCDGHDHARSRSTYPDGSIATALMFSVCPNMEQFRTHINGVHTMAHEYVHSIQVAVLTNTLDRKRFEPCWLREGGPEWTQAVVSDNFQQYLSVKHLEPYYLSTDSVQRTQTTARTWTKDEVDGYLNRANDPTTCSATSEFALAYSLGEVATETLVSIGGSESFFALQERLALGESSNQAFREIYGKSWDEVRPILAEVVAQVITLSWQSQALTYQSLPKN
jgi:hypothetical protein